MSNLNCAEFEIILADYLDGTLPAGQKAAVEQHAATCAACAELARDCSGAMAFMERAAEVAPPPVLVNRILLEVSTGVSRGVVKPTWSERWLAPLFPAWTSNVLRPRFAMSMAMLALSIAMLARFGPAAQVGVYRAWDRAMKSYDNIQLVYDVQNQLQEWRQDNGTDNR